MSCSLLSISNFIELEIGLQIDNNANSFLELLEYALSKDSKLVTTTIMKSMKMYLWGSSERGI